MISFFPHTIIRRIAPPLLSQAVVDLWVGGPNADGRGLDALNGGYSPALGLSITSPSADPGSSGTTRILLATNNLNWTSSTPIFAPKQAGVLAGIGGRYWNGSAWSYRGPNNEPLQTIRFIGPLTALSTLGVTNTIRRYSNTTGLTVSDTTGGVVHSYAQSCVVAAGQTGNNWFVTPTETLSTSYGRVIWHSIVETSTPELFAPFYGAHNGTSFVEGSQSIGPLSSTGIGSAGEFWWNKRYRGQGPNGGTLIEIVVVQAIWDNYLCSLRAYLLAAASGSPARSMIIHNHAAYFLSMLAGGFYGFPTWVLVANGAQAAIAHEEFEFGTFCWPATLFMRVDTRNRPYLFSGSNLITTRGIDAVTPLRLYHNLAETPGSPPYGSHAPGTNTFAVTISATRSCRAFLNGEPMPNGPFTCYPSSVEIGYRIGGDPGDERRPYLPYSSILIFDRILSNAEILAVHQQLAARDAGW